MALKRVNGQTSGSEDKPLSDRPLLQRVVGSSGLRIEVDEASAYWFTATSRQGTVPAGRRMPVSSPSQGTGDIESAIPAFEKHLSLRDPVTAPPDPESDKPQHSKPSALRFLPPTGARALGATTQVVNDCINSPNAAHEHPKALWEKLPSHTIV